MEAEIKQKQYNNLEYPKLMISNDNDNFIVLFTSQKEGYRLDKEFYYSENWDYDLFINFEGEIILKNK